MEDKEKKKKKKGAWHIGWGWYLAVPVLTVLSMALKRGINDVSDKTTSSVNALDILKERYVKGEIDKEEFDQKLRDIKEAR
ncbi:SHOCT domain-containing protein [Natronoflexus pectinivorans]|uniref:Putative membrane protein n=1 Tax=Natronoflexus pectinivorans TaxID=682526 RepID=A0A4V2RWZ9_9BACT|nr:SHOCT domain-containing protein [Natronoflexus pectinivorans]TCO10891.1 putative membrane protein [Natronoflexus pectinivorans]